MAETFDLLIIGGGINGVGTARDAVGRGLSVILCEKDDLGEGTSSRSGKYIHGGLRYLEHYEFRLVREALIEREVVLAAAPHLAWPLRLILPHNPDQRPRWLIRLGLFLYDHLGGRKRIPGSAMLDLRRDAVGQTLRDDFRYAFAYWDVWVDDARLVVLNAIDAARRGAEVLTRTECVSARRLDGLWHADLRDTVSGDVREVTARAIFNAGGPWVEAILGTALGINAQHRVRLVKGSHIILRRWWKGDHGYVLQSHDKRLIFVNPYFDDLALVGTTDIPFEGKPEDVAIDGDEIDYLVAILNRYFEIDLTSDDIVDTYAGVRPLFDDDSDKGASEVTRDYEFELNGGDDDRPPVLSAFGGKLTTYRKLAEHALAKLAPFFPKMSGDWTADAPLPGGNIPDVDPGSWLKKVRNTYPWMPTDLADHYARCYGSEVDKVLDGAVGLDDLGLHFGALLYEREAIWLIEQEWAQTAGDMLFRRTKHGLFLDAEEKAAVAEWLQQRSTA